MARIRSVKPEFWQDEDLAEVPRDARLLYIGLWNLSDEHGRLRGDPRYVKGQLFPYDDDLSAYDVDALLKALEAARKVRRYRVGLGQYLFLPNLDKHQRLEGDKVPSKLPPPPDPSGDDDPPSAAQIRADKSAPRVCADRSGTQTGLFGGSEAPPRPSVQDHAPQRGRSIEQAPDQPKLSAQIGADLSARDADKSSLLYVAGSMEHGACKELAATPRAVAPPTIGQRAKRITDEYHATEPLSKWPAVNAIVLRALKTDRYSDNDIRAALARLAADNRSVTVDTLRIELGPPAENVLTLPINGHATPNGRRPSATDRAVAEGLAVVAHFEALEAEQARKEIGP